MTETNAFTNSITHEEWEAQRTQAWRDAWIKFINCQSPDYLNGLFCGLTGDASIFPLVFARYHIEEIVEIPDDGESVIEDYRKAYNELSPEKKQALLDTQLEDGFSLKEEQILELDDMFTRCMNLDERFKEEDDDDTSEPGELEDDDDNEIAEDSSFK